MKKFAIVGFGSRGQLFGRLIRDDETAQLYAVAEPIRHSREKAQNEFGVPAERCYGDAEGFFAQGKICDAVFICTQDCQHYGHVMKALSLGYDVCLEKPAAVSLRECESIRDTAQKLGRKVMLTHVLRYSPFFLKIKELIDGGALGEVATINLTENVAYWHFALSYVRGPWRDTAKSTPAIIAKCCHDLDLIVWLMGGECSYVNSYGGLFYYNREHAPEGSADYCVDCDPVVKENCLYNAFKIYPERVKTAVVGGTAAVSQDDVLDVISNREHIWGRCVYRCDNDAADHQVVNMQFSNGATAHLTMTAFSERCYRFIKVHGTQGEIYGDLEEAILYYTPYGKPQQIIDVNKLSEIELNDGHGGGDYYLYKDFYDYIDGKPTSVSRTSIEASIESHLIGFAAEESRASNGKNMPIRRKTI